MSEWILASNKQPTLDYAVFVYPNIPNENKLVGYYWPYKNHKKYEQGKWYRDDENGYPYKIKVTHWIPLPEPPKKDTK